MNANDAQAYTVEVCQNVLLNLAAAKGIQPADLKLRIDMQNAVADPVYALFDKVIGKNTFIERCTLKEIIHAGGGQGLAMILGMHIKGIIRDIFKASLLRFEITNTKQLFLTLYLQQKGTEFVPMIAVFKNGQFMDAEPIGGIIGVTNDNTQT